MALYNNNNKIIGSNITDVEEAKMNEMIANKIVTNIDNSSTNDTIPSAKTVWNNTMGEVISSVDKYGDDVLRFPCGVYNFSLTATAEAFSNLPQLVAGILTVTSISPSTTLNNAWCCRNYRFETYLGAVWYRTVNIGSAPGVINYDTGWEKICRTKVVDSSGNATINNGATGTISYKVKNGVAYVSVHNLAEGLTGVQACSITGLPKPDGYVNVDIEKLGTRVGTIFTDDGATFYVHKISTDAGYASFSYLVAEN